MQSFAYRLNFSDSNMAASLLTEETRSTAIPFWNNFVRRHWWNQSSNSEFGSGAKGDGHECRRQTIFAGIVQTASRSQNVFLIPPTKPGSIQMAQAFLELAWKEEQKDFQPTED